ncbi:unnamed protein product [Cladocopium goreaui]|uniref:3-phosphoinositide-dependent protein kinase 2 n=1 Tax=Cladocopium goreaui TaxID=2562237 RepID=A0A9P1BS48_9DINO|nr:unnamed protein product [Cladocopium goreaui]
MSFLAHLDLDPHVAFAEQHFLWVPGRFPRRFTPGKQTYLDTAMNGLRYSGYVDAVIQRWALVADEYLRRRQDFVLLRYEAAGAGTGGNHQAMGPTLCRIQWVKRESWRRPLVSADPGMRNEYMPPARYNTKAPADSFDLPNRLGPALDDAQLAAAANHL